MICVSQQDVRWFSGPANKPDARLPLQVINRPFYDVLLLVLKLFTEVVVQHPVWPKRSQRPAFQQMFLHSETHICMINRADLRLTFHH
jgi:hypothetical protein